MFLSLTITFTSLLALLPLATALLPDTSNTGLFNVGKAAGKKYFGTATDNPELTDTAYVAQLSNINEFGQLTPVCLQDTLRKNSPSISIISEKQYEMGQHISVGA